MHFEVAGTGPNVLLVQGVGVAGCGWAPQVEALQQDYTLAWFDNRGIGRSPGSPGSVKDMATATLEVLDALGWDQAHIVGHSLGGMIAQRVALDAPSRVKSLSLLCTFARGSSTLSVHPAAVWRQLRTVFGSRAMRQRAFFELVSPTSVPPTPENIAVVEQAFGRHLVDLPPATPSQVYALVRADHRAELPALAHLPTLVVSAHEDKLAPPSQGVLLAELLQTTVHELPGGHALPVQSASTINALLRTFWSSAEPSDGTNCRRA